MDTYTISVFGHCLNVEKLCKDLPELKIESIRRVGETSYWSNGATRSSARNKAFDESSVGFETSSQNLADLLEFLIDKKISHPVYGIDEIEIHALMERSGQINGELRRVEIEGLWELNAIFTWSVIIEGD